MWNAVVPAMLAVDPTLKFVGPATAGGQFGFTASRATSTSTRSCKGATVLPYAISFHGYGYWDNTVTDKWIFDGDNTGAGGIQRTSRNARRSSYPRSNYPSKPFWITEINVNADWGEDTHHRPWNEFAAAWWAAAYTELAPVNVAMLDHYNIVESPQFGLLDYDTGNPFLPYWIVKSLNAGFPTSSQRLSATSADTHQIEVTAARKPSGEITVLVVDRKIDTAQPRGGHGLPLDIDVILDGITPTAITLQQIDVNTSPNDRPDDGEPAPGFTRDAALPRLRARAAYDLDALAVLSGNGTRTWGSHIMLSSSDCSPTARIGAKARRPGRRSYILFQLTNKPAGPRWASSEGAAPGKAKRPVAAVREPKEMNRAAGRIRDEVSLDVEQEWPWPAVRQKTAGLDLRPGPRVVGVHGLPVLNRNCVGTKTSRDDPIADVPGSEHAAPGGEELYAPVGGDRDHPSGVDGRRDPATAPEWTTDGARVVIAGARALLRLARDDQPRIGALVRPAPMRGREGDRAAAADHVHDVVAPLVRVSGGRGVAAFARRSPMRYAESPTA